MENSHAWLGASTSASIAGKSGKYSFCTHFLAEVNFKSLTNKVFKIIS